jgi:hypothetical protein
MAERFRRIMSDNKVRHQSSAHTTDVAVYNSLNHLLNILCQRIAGTAVNAALITVDGNFSAGPCGATICAYQHHITNVNRRFLLNTTCLGSHIGGAALVFDHQVGTGHNYEDPIGIIRTIFILLTHYMLDFATVAFVVAGNDLNRIALVNLNTHLTISLSNFA